MLKTGELRLFKRIDHFSDYIITVELRHDIDALAPGPDLFNQFCINADAFLNTRLTGLFHTLADGLRDADTRHFVMQKEILGMQLLTEHNLSFLFALMAGAREAIADGNFAGFKERWSAPW